MPAGPTAPDPTTPLALRCAAHVHAAIGWRAPEAGALAAWLHQCAHDFGREIEMLDEDGDPVAVGPRFPRLSAGDWHRIGAALRDPEAAGPPGGVLTRWVAAIARRLALDPTETALLSLALHYRIDARMERLFDLLSRARGGAARLRGDPALIGLLLGAAPEAIARCLTGAGRLFASGLLRLAPDGELGVFNRLVGLARNGVPPAADFYDQLLGTATAAPLPWDSFDHLGAEADLAATTLRAALAERARGTHLLLYGPAGTGKTSFAASLVARIGARLRVMGETDDDGAEPNRAERLAALRLGQCLAPAGETVLLFDEAEDLFPGDAFAARHGLPRTAPRVFIHRMLDASGVPVIWTANDISVLGPAVLRRMTMCVEMRIPAIPTRARLWRRMGAAEGVALTEAEAVRLARLVPAAPAVAATALRATRLVGGDAETARLLVAGVARAVAGGRSAPPEAPAVAAYDPGLVNADADLAALADRLAAPGASRAVSLLALGAPGTGKSAWLRHLAERMGFDLLQKRASDLLDPYVGGTERRIADAFAEARETGAFLLLEEADALLRDRAEARHGWEVSQVDELLGWMETHPLPFACTTNLPDRLDGASLRRFLVKLRFSWITAAQARAAFRRFFAQEPPAGLDGLSCLTPADFALVARRAALEGVADPAALLRLLAAESAGRSYGRGKLGFAAAA